MIDWIPFGETWCLMVLRWTMQAVEMAAVISGELDWCVIEADCFQVMAWLPDKSVAHVITDPPYAPRAMKNARSAETIKQRRDGKTYDFGYAALAPAERRSLAREFARVAQRWILVWTDIESDHAWRVWFARSGLRYVRTSVWFRELGAPQFSGDRPAQDVEACVIAHAAGRLRWNGGGHGGSQKGPIVNAAAEERVHTSPKPLWLMLRQIKDFTDPGEVILDAFAGSGTTGVAARRLHRRAILIERDPKYAAIARQRMEAETKGQSLSAYRSGQMTLFESAPSVSTVSAPTEQEALDE